MVCCPQCHSKRIWKDGLRRNASELIQRFLCRDCGLRFSDRGNKIFALDHSMCVTHKGTNKLAATETIKATKRESNKGQLISFAWHLKKMGRAESTIITYTHVIEALANVCDLEDPESVKLAIATHYRNRNTMRSACCAYDAYLRFIGEEWNKPKYKVEHKTVFIPNDKEIQIAINAGIRSSMIFSHLIYETGARVNEAERLEWTDINEERSQVTIKSSKNGKARILNVSKQLIDKLLSLPKKQNMVFKRVAKGSRQQSLRTRLKRLAAKHNNPRLLKIHYHTFRHCKALREYDKTHNILRVKRILGHKSLLTTQRYVDLYEELYDSRPRETICEIALNVREAKKLIELGFEYETGEYCDGGKLFKKYR